MAILYCMRKRVLIFLGIAAAILTGLNQYNNYKSQEIQKSIASKILRFHVLANSDEKADQDVKLLVRNAVGTYLEPYLSGCKSLEESKQVINEKMEEIIAVSEDTLKKNGFDYSVIARITTTEFPDKQYGDYTFPKGKYEALQIVIGEGRGHNWWCVLYPQMCFRGSVYEIVDDGAKEELRELLTTEEYETVINGGKYEIRFKALEFFEKNS